MGNPRPTNPKKFVKGQVANPLGAGAHNKEVKAIRRLTHDEVAEVGSLIMDGNLKRLVEIRDNPATTVLKVWMCSVAIKAINKGDAQSLNALLDRIVGKPKDSNITVVVNREAPPMTKAEVAEMVRDAQKEC